MRYGYWILEPSGEIFAVQIGDDGLALAVAGPLAQAEATRANLEAANFDFDPEDAAWINGHRVALYEPEAEQ